jgi:hypothetical protein
MYILAPGALLHSRENNSREQWRERLWDAPAIPPLLTHTSTTETGADAHYAATPADAGRGEAASTVVGTLP